MSDSDKIKLPVLPTETMHADLTWLLINPANMATKDQPVKQKDWVEVPTHVVHIEHPSGKKLTGTPASHGTSRPAAVRARGWTSADGAMERPGPVGDRRR